MRASVPVLLLLVLSLPMLSACGLKDDLYLPTESANPAAASEPDESEEHHAENSRT